MPYTFQKYISRLLGRLKSEPSDEPPPFTDDDLAGREATPLDRHIGLGDEDRA